MILKLLPTGSLSRLTAASIALIGPAFSQAPPADPSAPAAQKSVQVQVVVVGQSVPPRYELVKSVRIKELRGGADGQSSGPSLPEQDQNNVPLQIAPTPDELPPSPLYIKTGKNWTLIPVRENTASPKVAVPLTASVVVAAAKEVTAADGKKSQDYKPLGEFPIAESQTGMLILVVKDPRQPLKWVILRSFAIDTSWSKLPAGSFTVFNASCLPLRGQIATNPLASVPIFEKSSVVPKSDESGQVPYYLEVQHPDGSWNLVVNTSTTLNDGGRIIAIPYGVVLPETRRYASFMVIRDFQDQGALNVPKPRAGAEAVTAMP
jgi:hypothetical protein